MSTDIGVSDVISARAARIVRAIREVSQSADGGSTPPLEEAICEFVAALKREHVLPVQAESILERAMTASGALADDDSAAATNKAVLAYCMSKYYDGESGT